MALLGRLPLHPLLFAAYAVLFLYAANLDAVLPVDVAPPLAWALVAAGVALAILSLVYRSARRGAIVATALVVAFFGFGHVASTLAGTGIDERLQLAAWAVLVVVAVIYAARARTSIPRTTASLNVLAIVLVLMATISIVPFEIQRASRGAVPGIQPVAAAGHVDRKPDIYFLIFDRYGSADAIQRRFGITGNDLYGWLKDRGFQEPKVSRNAYRATDFSLASTLNMKYLDELTTRIGRVSKDRTPAQAMLKDHAVGMFLKAQGYTYYQLGTWFEPTRSIPIADFNLSLGVTSEFESVLRDTTIEPAIERALGITSQEPTFLDRVREGTLYELRQLHRIATAPGPKFVFAHILLPHDPYVFRADGSLITEAEVKKTPEKQLYADHLAFANAQIKSLVDQLLAGPDETDPVVIIQGDEGPLACQAVDCVDTTPEYFAIRTGVLDAMYLPGVTQRLPDEFTSVNTFRFVFDQYFGADLPLLPDHTYTWPDNDHIYDFRDIRPLLKSLPPPASP